MNPTIGRVVIYKTTEADKAFMKATQCNVVDELPATIVNVWGATMINAKVDVDGPQAALWKTSIQEGDQPGKWHWPVLVPAAPFPKTE